MPAFDAQHADTALSAYLNLLKNKGAATAVITRRKHFLRHLLSALEQATQHPPQEKEAYYRQATDATLARFSQDQQVEIISTVREFYPFWMDDLKTIARLHAADALSLEQAPIDLRGGLMEMFEHLDADPWVRSEHVCLQHYLQHLNAQGLEDAARDIRERLLLLLLYLIRQADATPAAYRAGVDAMLTLFSKEETRRLFIEMAREFFPFWNSYQDTAVSLDPPLFSAS